MFNNFQSFNSEGNEDSFIKLTKNYVDDLEFINHSLLSNKYMAKKIKNYERKTRKHTPIYYSLQLRNVFKCVQTISDTSLLCIK